MENLLMTRRELLAATAALSITYCLPASLGATVSPGDMPQRILGRTGIKVSLLGLGGYHIGKPSEEAEGIGIIRAAIDNGITFRTTAGITTTAPARSAWERHCGTGTARRSS